MILTNEKIEELENSEYDRPKTEYGYRMKNLIETIDGYGHFTHGQDGGQALQELYILACAIDEHFDE